MIKKEVIEKKIFNSNMKPIVKWAGGKKQLLPELIKLIPDSYNRYIEPFFGGGALFFKLNPKYAIISDINFELITLMKVLKKDHKSLIKKLNYFEKNNSLDFFLKIRDLEYDNPVDIASRFLYLNKSCFNGLYRLNSKGKFNTPYGKKDSIKIYDKDNLLNISNFLNENKIKIMNCDYNKVFQYVENDDFLFIDPPYDTDNNNFTSYTKNGFNRDDQKKLSNTLDDLSLRGIKWMMTNSNTKFIMERYSHYNIKEVEVNRFINSNSKKRIKSAKEVIITNYEK